MRIFVDYSVLCLYEAQEVVYVKQTNVQVFILLIYVVQLQVVDAAQNQ